MQDKISFTEFYQQVILVGREYFKIQQAARCSCIAVATVTHDIVNHT